MFDRAHICKFFKYIPSACDILVHINVRINKWRYYARIFSTPEQDIIVHEYNHTQLWFFKGTHFCQRFIFRILWYFIAPVIFLPLICSIMWHIYFLYRNQRQIPLFSWLETRELHQTLLDIGFVTCLHCVDIRFLKSCNIAHYQE